MKKNTYFDKKNVSKENIEKYVELNKFILNNYPNDNSRNFQLGYELLGPLLVGFSYWINKNKIINENDNLIFLARDGYIVKKAYNILFPKEETNYMYVSRRSLALPSINFAKNNEEIINSIVLPPIFNIKVFCEGLGLDYKKYIEVFKKLDIDINDNFKRSELKTNVKINKLLELLNDEIIDKANEQYKYFAQYLKELSFNKKVGIIDIGWHNSIQKNIENVISESSMVINGYYIGVYDNAKKVKHGNSAEGYLYSYGNNTGRQFKTFSFVSLFELMFLSDEGTTIRYDKEKDSIKPQLLNEKNDVDEKTKQIMKEFQKGAEYFVSKFKESNFDINYLLPDVCSANLICFGCNPRKDDLKIYEQLCFENYSVHNIINYNKTTLYYITHLKEAKRDFFQSGWRIMFLRKLIKLPLPYNFIFNMICKLFKRN